MKRAAQVMVAVARRAAEAGSSLDRIVFVLRREDALEVRASNQCTVDGRALPSRSGLSISTAWLVRTRSGSSLGRSPPRVRRSISRDRRVGANDGGSGILGRSVEEFCLLHFCSDLLCALVRGRHQGRQLGTYVPLEEVRGG
jgi:hypothetical protein